MAFREDGKWWVSPMNFEEEVVFLVVVAEVLVVLVVLVHEHIENHRSYADQRRLKCERSELSCASDRGDVAYHLATALNRGVQERNKSTVQHFGDITHASEVRGHICRVEDSLLRAVSCLNRGDELRKSGELFYEGVCVLYAL